MVIQYYILIIPTFIILVNEDKNIKLKQIIKDIYKKEGLRGFYRGFYFSLIAGSLANLIFFWK